MKAVVVQETGKAAIQDIPEFKLRPDYIKIQVKAVALNPTDWKHIDKIAKSGAVVGCDVSGTVLDVGEKVTTPVKRGDAVYGFVHGCNVSNHEDGGFAESCLMKDGLFVPKPDNISFEEAASLGCGVGTVGQAIYQAMGAPTPDQPAKTPFYVLVYGGSTATGSLGVQFAKLSGLKVLATASPKNHAWLESLGAEKVFDYNDPDCGAKIREYTKDNLRHAFDCIALADSQKICADALASSRDGGEIVYVALLPPKGFPRQEDVTTKGTMLYTATGETYEKMNRTVNPDPKDREYIANWYKIANKFVADGKIKPHPIELGKGFDGVLDGLNKMRSGDYSAKKLVYTIS